MPPALLLQTIELAEGEELVYVNEEGQVVDEEGNLILDGEGNPMTLEDLENGGAAPAELTEDEVGYGGCCCCPR